MERRCGFCGQEYPEGFSFRHGARSHEWDEKQATFFLCATCLLFFWEHQQRENNAEADRMEEQIRRLRGGV